MAEINGERTQAGILASTVVEAGHMVTGRAAIVRPTEQTVVVGDLPGGALAESSAWFPMLTMATLLDPGALHRFSAAVAS